MGAVIHFLTVWWGWIDLGATIAAVASIPSVLVRRRGRPGAALSWILALLALPVLGIFLWWLMGRRHLERRRRRRRRAHDTISERLESVRHTVDPPESRRPPPLLPLAHLPDELSEGVFPPTADNEVVLLSDGDVFDEMEAEIAAAKHHIHALFYIWKNDETGRRFRDLLIEKAEQGVEVRVLCDAIGSPAIATRFSRPLRKAGAKVARFLPPQLLSRSPRLHFRNHRKIFVVDGISGVIGGFNIADEYRKRWRDSAVRIRGPAVDQLQEIFADDWYYATHEDLADPTYFGKSGAHPKGGANVAVIASGPDTLFNSIHDTLFIAINRTTRRLYITTPYFIPTPPILAAIRAAEYRGVDVRILLPAESDVPLVRYAARSYYSDLIAVGARIFEYQRAMIHAKTMVLDEDLAVMGSANLDSRSFRLNFEASVFVGGSELNGALAAQFETDGKQAIEVKLADVQNQPWSGRLLDATAHLLSPLL